MKRNIHKCKYVVRHYFLGVTTYSFYRTYIGAWLYKTYINVFNVNECAKIVKNIFYNN